MRVSDASTRSQDHSLGQMYRPSRPPRSDRDRRRPGGPLTRLQRLAAKKRLRLAVWKAASGRCVYCAERIPLDRVTIDHVIPRCEGGADDRGNCVSACTQCNKAKGAMSIHEFITEHPHYGRNFIRLARTVCRKAHRSARRALSLRLAS